MSAPVVLMAGTRFTSEGSLIDLEVADGDEADIGGDEITRHGS